MTLYTSKVIAQWLCLTERRVRQLRDEGVIVEARPGLYELQPTVARYIKYLGGAGKESLNTERMKLTAEKRKAAEMDNDLRRGDLHSTQDIEKGIQTMCLNIRSRFLAIQNGRSRHLQRRYWRGGNTVRTYKHLTMTDRLRIEKWLKMGMKPREIADKLRVHVSTIYRELKRGAYDRLDGATWEVKTAYSPDIAEDKYQAHLREKGPDLKIGSDHELANYIETTIINKDCSPAAVLGFAMIEGKKFKTSLSVPTIYKYIAKGLFLNLTQEELPRHGKKKHKYKKVKKNKSASRAPAGESIEQRPEEIDEREEFGHWEGDTVYSGRGKRKTTRALLTLTERKTRKEIIIAIPNRKAETVVKALDALERKLGAQRFRAIFKSITFDNGTEFAAAEGLERSCVNKRLPRTKVYFCHPYSSWERGTNENTNGMIRRRFPKGTNFAAVTNAQIAQAENWINNYPRKILGYKSSEIVFRECLRELGIAA